MPHIDGMVSYEGVCVPPMLGRLSYRRMCVTYNGLPYKAGGMSTPRCSQPNHMCYKPGIASQHEGGCCVVLGFARCDMELPVVLGCYVGTGCCVRMLGVLRVLFVLCLLFD